MLGTSSVHTCCIYKDASYFNEMRKNCENW